jgi:hypothetical protein
MRMALGDIDHEAHDLGVLQDERKRQNLDAASAKKQK